MFNLDKEKLRKLLDKLNAKARNAIIVVEGEKDRDALESLGIQNDFFCINKYKRSLQECAELLAQNHTNAILLLDSDKKGQELAGKLKAHLQKLGVKADAKIGVQILKTARQRTVESIRL